MLSFITSSFSSLSRIVLLVAIVVVLSLVFSITTIFQIIEYLCFFLLSSEFSSKVKLKKLNKNVLFSFLIIGFFFFQELSFSLLLLLFFFYSILLCSFSNSWRFVLLFYWKVIFLSRLLFLFFLRKFSFPR